MDDLSRVVESAEQIRRHCSGALGSISPRLGIVLGSGLTGIAGELQESTQIPYADIPNFPRTTVLGHPGALALGTFGEKTVAVLVGRLHAYEGHSMREVVFPVRVLRELGCETLILTNAAGGLNPLFWPGDLMVITDHVSFPNLAGISPLAGPQGETFGPRFLDLNGAYDPELIDLAVSVGRELGLDLRRGVYAMVGGPSYETPAEVRLLRSLGIDAVGMSTVPEVLAARQRGMRVLALSSITNMASGIGASFGHEDVVAHGQTTGPLLTMLLREIVRRL